VPIYVAKRMYYPVVLLVSSYFGMLSVLMVTLELTTRDSAMAYYDTAYMVIL